MIRAAFYFLTVLNCGLLAWQLWFKDDGTRQLSNPVSGDLPSIKLVSEVQATSRTPTRRSDRGSQQFECLALGPFVEREEARAAMTWLDERNVEGKQRIEKEQVRLGFQVSLPQFETRSEAMDMEEQLRADGVDDIYVETDGELRNTVMLGLFSERKRADKRAAAIRELGVNPEIKERSREAFTYWIDFWRLPRNKEITDEALSSFKLSDDRIVRAGSSEQCDKDRIARETLMDIAPELLDIIPTE